MTDDFADFVNELEQAGATSLQHRNPEDCEACGS